MDKQSTIAALWMALLAIPASARASDENEGTPRHPSKIGYPSLMSPHSAPIALHGGLVFVANTPSDTVDVIDAKRRKIVARIDVGIDPVNIAVRPDGKEIWVANHVSDSVSVIDNDPKSPTHFQVVATVQDIDLDTKATRFDEPVGIAFANNEKAYVALSSENKIAVVDVASRKVTNHIAINAQDPRAIVVRGDRLYVIPFESNNKTQLSGGYKIDGDLVTFNAHEHSIANNNVLSLGHVTDIVKHPRVPDRDLFVIDTKSDKIVEVVDTLGTLLYGLAVDSKGRALIAQTDARNDVNGRAGTKKHGLAELENRAFLNQITRVEFDGKGSAKKPEFFDLEPLPPSHPQPGMALATPFAIQVSDDDSTLIVSAAASDKVFTVDAATGDVLGRVDVGAAPRGIALNSDEKGKPSEAWILNAVENSVSLVDISDPAELNVEATIPLHDPTHPVFKRGRIAFNTARASTTGTFACASCHSDGHTDQLLWVLKTPIVTGGDQIMPRSTMPLRGLRDTAPFHWDGIPGDPYGGNNSAHVRGSVDPNSDVNIPESATRHLIDGGLATTMAMVGDTTKNDEGKAGLLTGAERDDMAKFLLGITYPPAQRRAYSNELSERAKEGFELFHIHGDNDPTKPRPNVCGDCHRMPFWVSTNTPGTGMDAPTWRGAYDRFLILPQGRLNVIDFDFYRRVAEQGIPERNVWQFSWAGRSRFDPVWEMVLEGSTGFSGAFARQATLRKETVDDPVTRDLLGALEEASGEGGVVLQVEGTFLNEVLPRPVKLQFDAHYQSGKYVETEGKRRSFTRAELISLAAKGEFIATFTGRHGQRATIEDPQPALWTQSPIHAQSGRQEFPVLYGEAKTMAVHGRHIREGAHVVVNGRRVPGSVRFGKGEALEIRLEALPSPGLHFVQVQNRNGLFSNDFIFHVAKDEADAKRIEDGTNPERLLDALAAAIAEGDLGKTKKLVEGGVSLTERRGEDGMTALSSAAFHGKFEIAEYLIEKGARVSRTNRDGNTPLHIAAFFGRREMVELLLENGATVSKENGRGESAIDVVSGEWDEGLEGFYKALNEGANLGLDLGEIREIRPIMAKRLREKK